MEKEIWKPVKGYEGIYEVSNLGRVRSIERIILGNNGRSYHIDSKILKPNKTRNYLGVLLSNKGMKKYVNIHRLVAIAFIENKENNPQINHIDEDKLNNHVENLEWVTNRENTNHSKNKISTSRYPGVYWNKRAKKWYSQCQMNGKRYYIGLFVDELDAAESYQIFCRDNNLK